MKLRKTFISPRVLETCEVALELNLLGNSTLQFSGTQRAVGQEVDEVSDYQNIGWD